MRHVLAILFASFGIAAVALAQPAKTGPSYRGRNLRQTARPEGQSRQDHQGADRDSIHAHQQEQPRREVHRVRRDRHRDPRPGQERQVRGRRARLRQARRLPEGPPVLRLQRRPLRQPHRQGEVHARRQGVHARDQQRARTTCTAARRASTRSTGRASRSWPRPARA